MPVWILVEDEPDIHEVIVAMFHIWGVDGVAFGDGVTAITWLEAVDQDRIVEKLPDLAILDIRLPRVSGIEVAARLRKSRYMGNIPILLMTAYRLRPHEEREVLQLSGADGVLYKPLPPMGEFRRILDHIIVKRRAGT